MDKGRTYFHRLDRLDDLLGLEVLEDFIELRGLEVGPGPQILRPDAIIVRLLDELVYQPLLRPNSLQPS